jgi:hypothetical protein
MIAHLTNPSKIKILAQAITSTFTLLKIHQLQARSPRCRRIRLSLNSKESRLAVLAQIQRGRLFGLNLKKVPPQVNTTIRRALLTQQQTSL